MRNQSPNNKELDPNRKAGSFEEHTQAYQRPQDWQSPNGKVVSKNYEQINNSNKI